MLSGNFYIAKGFINMRKALRGKRRACFLSKIRFTTDWKRLWHGGKFAQNLFDLKERGYR